MSPVVPRPVASQARRFAAALGAAVATLLGQALWTGVALAHEGHEHTTESASAVGGADPSLLLAIVGGVLMAGWGLAYAREMVSDRVAAAGVLVGLVVLLFAAFS